MATHNQIWLDAVNETLGGYRRMIDAAVQQLTDDELHCRPNAETNSVAILLRHLGGNLRSRWTDFLTTDGEKPDRDRDREFEDWSASRAALMAHFDAGWKALEKAVSDLNEGNVNETILIRGEPHSIPLAIVRSVTHIAYHVGQIVMIARTVHQGEWQWLTIAPGQSSAHNESTWGTDQSRGVFGRSADQQ